MAIHKFFDEARRRALLAEDAADLRRTLKNLPVRYAAQIHPDEVLAGYEVGEQRLTALRNEAALCSIRREPDFRSRILDMLARFTAEASMALRRDCRADDLSNEPARRTVNLDGRIPAAGWFDTALPSTFRSEQRPTAR
jgi:hypothetical protein